VLQIYLVLERQIAIFQYDVREKKDAGIVNAATSREPKTP
jgi:hypothetical protein